MLHNNTHTDSRLVKAYRFFVFRLWKFFHE